MTTVAVGTLPVNPFHGTEGTLGQQPQGRHRLVRRRRPGRGRRASSPPAACPSGRRGRRLALGLAGPRQPVLRLDAATGAVAERDRGRAPTGRDGCRRRLSLGGELRRRTRSHGSTRDRARSRDDRGRRGAHTGSPSTATRSGSPTATATRSPGSTRLRVAPIPSRGRRQPEGDRGRRGQGLGRELRRRDGLGRRRRRRGEPIEVGGEPRGVAAAFGSVWVSVSVTDEAVRIDPRPRRSSSGYRSARAPRASPPGRRASGSRTGLQATLTRIDPGRASDDMRRLGRAREIERR